MTDYLGMQRRLWQAIRENAGKAIDEVLKEAWNDGYRHGREDKVDRELREVKDDNRNE